MKQKPFTLIVMLLMTVSASAQVEMLYHYANGSYSHYTAIDRAKKLYWMDDDSNTCFVIKNYKKSGTTETFVLEPQEKGEEGSQVTTTLDASGHTATIRYKNRVFYGGMKYDVKTNIPDDPNEHNRLVRYFNGLAGNPTDQGIVSRPSSGAAKVLSKDNQSGESQSKTPIDKVKGTAKDAVGKIKGIFKKK